MFFTLSSSILQNIDMITGLVPSHMLSSLDHFSLQLYIFIFYHITHSADQPVTLSHISDYFSVEESKVQLCLDYLCSQNFLLYDEFSDTYTVQDPSSVSPTLSNSSFSLNDYSLLVQQFFLNSPIYTSEALSRYTIWVNHLKLSRSCIAKLFHHAVENMDPPDFHVLDLLAAHIANTDNESDCDTILERDRISRKGALNLLSGLGMERHPTDAEILLYQKWLYEWNIPESVIQDTLRLTTSAPNPSLKYIDGILKREKHMLQNSSLSDTAIAAYREENEQIIEQILKITSLLGAHPDFSDEKTLIAYKAAYAKITSLYPEPIIMLGAYEVAALNGSMKDLVNLLFSWKNRGFTTENEIKQYILDFKTGTHILYTLSELWGQDQINSPSCRDKVMKWIRQYHLTEKEVLAHADSVTHKNHPFTALDEKLNKQYGNSFSRQSPSNKRKSTKVSSPVNMKVTEQEYDQRADLENDENSVPDWLKNRT